ncbi:MAG: hypothetical protein M3165_08615 [Actinomycetota bacterium]|nr:hypothetical protein [Actinomycetota bacterium]
MTDPSTPSAPAGPPDRAAQTAGRTEEILRLADEEAAAVRAQATQDAEAVRAQAQREADTVRAEAQRDAADTRLAALAEAESIREQALAESQERRADLEREADELVLSVWWLAERIRVAAGKEPRDLPRIGDDLDTPDAAATSEQPGDAVPAYASEEALARHSALRRAAVAAQRGRRTTEAAQEESERTLARARREAEELLNRARAEAEHLVAGAQAEGERALASANRRVESLNRERDGILTSLTELTQHTAGLDLQQTAPPPGR